jgi:hypothetical protein
VARARDKGDATIAARRVLLLAGAVAGLWLVSWWLSGHAQAATREANPIGEVVAGVIGGQPPGGAGQTPKDESPSAAGVVAPVAGGVEPVSQVVSAAEPVSQVVSAAAPVTEPISRVARSGAPVVEPVSQVVRAAAPVVEPVSQVVRAAAPVAEPVVRSVEPVVEPVSQAVRAAVPVVEPVVRAAAPVARPVLRSVEPVLEPVSQVVGAVAPVVDPVLDPVLDTVAPVTDSVGSTMEPVTDALSPVTEPIGDTLAPVVEPIVAPGSEGAAPSTPEPSTKPLIRQARQAKAAPPHRETVPTTHQGVALPTAPDRTYDRPSPATGPTATTPRQAHQTHRAHPVRQATPSQLARAPGNAPAPRYPAPDDAACGAAPTIPPAFLTPDHGPRATHAFTPSHGDFVPLWRACEPGTGPG